MPTSGSRLWWCDDFIVELCEDRNASVISNTKALLGNDGPGSMRGAGGERTDKGRALVTLEQPSPHIREATHGRAARAGARRAHHEGHTTPARQKQRANARSGTRWRRAWGCGAGPWARGTRGGCASAPCRGPCSKAAGPAGRPCSQLAKMVSSDTNSLSGAGRWRGWRS